MITVEKIEAANGNPPGVRVRFTWIEPTHDVVELLQKENMTDGFRSVDGAYVLEQYLFETLDQDKANEYLDIKASQLVNDIGRGILQLQQQRSQQNLEAATTTLEEAFSEDSTEAE